MKIYTRLVIDIDTLHVVDEQSFEYSGPVAECKGGGSTEVNSTDPVYNAGMLKLSELASEKGVEYDNLFKYGVLYNPEEKQQGLMIDGKWVAATDLTPEQTGGEQWIDNPKFNSGHYEWSTPTYGQGDSQYQGEPVRTWVLDKDAANQPAKILNPNFKLQSRTLGEVNKYDPNAQISELQLMQQQLASESGLLPLREGLERQQIEADTRLTPLRAQTEEQSLADTRTALSERAPLRSQFFQAAGKGINIGQRMDQAQAEVQQAGDLQARNLRREMEVSQVNPGDPAYQQMLNQSALDRSKSIAAARTTARDTGEDEQFKRLAMAASYGV